MRQSSHRSKVKDSVAVVTLSIGGYVIAVATLPPTESDSVEAWVEAGEIDCQAAYIVMVMAGMLIISGIYMPSISCIPSMLIVWGGATLAASLGGVACPPRSW